MGHDLRPARSKEAPELGAILQKGCAYTGLTISRQAEDTTVRLSEGSPHCANLLAHRAAELVVQGERGRPMAEDLTAAISGAVNHHTRF
jgi:hypothetical protein